MRSKTERKYALPLNIGQVAKNLYFIQNAAQKLIF